MRSGKKFHEIPHIPKTEEEKNIKKPGQKSKTIHF